MWQYSRLSASLQSLLVCLCAYVFCDGTVFMTRHASARRGQCVCRARDVLTRGAPVILILLIFRFVACFLSVEHSARHPHLGLSDQVG